MGCAASRPEPECTPEDVRPGTQRPGDPGQPVRALKAGFEGQAGAHKPPQPLRPLSPLREHVGSADEEQEAEQEADASSSGTDSPQPDAAFVNRTTGTTGGTGGSRGALSLASLAGGGSGGGRGGVPGAGLGPAAWDLRVFRIDEMRRATGAFSQKLGEGGFGVVYRGQVQLQPSEGPADVAVKVLRHDGNQGLKEWQAEVIFLSSMRHTNLVRLYGYCCDGDDWMLVYEFVPNRSFDCHLFPRKGMPVLSFRQRLKVVLGAAQGLAYLHSGQPGGGTVIYRDLKTSNILVDKDFNAKLSDFGLAREGPEGSRSHISTDIVGTSGYLAPEYITRGHVSERCDVFSFGVVLLELITGRSADSEPERAHESMVQWAARVAGEGREGWRQLVDPRLRGAYPTFSVKSTLKAAFMCIQQDPKARPSMENVIETLKVAYTRSMEDESSAPTPARR